MSNRKTRIIEINRPERLEPSSSTLAQYCSRNAVNAETSDALMAAVLDFESDPSVRVAVIAGRGGTFCAGYDLKQVLILLSML